MANDMESDPILSKWFSSVVKEGTKKQFLVAIKKYLEFTKKTPRQLIEEAIEDMKKSPLDRRDIVKSQLIGFYKWLMTEADKHRPNGFGKHKVVGKGLSSMSAFIYTSHVRSFYGVYDIVVKLKGSSKIEGTPEHTRLVFSQTNVKKLYDTARTLRDKAIVMFLFQSGCDVSTLVRIKFKQVAGGLEKNEEPLMIEATRSKTNTKFFTFIGKEAIFALRNYLTELNRQGVDLQPDDPLFLRRNYAGVKKHRLPTYAVMALCKGLAIRAGLIRPNGDGDNFNIAGSHAFRESFTSILHNRGKGIDSEQILLLTGHRKTSVDSAYLKEDADSLRQIYKENEHLLSIGLLASPTIVDVSEMDKLKDQVKELRMAVYRFTQIKPEHLQEAYQKTVEEESGSPEKLEQEESGRELTKEEFDKIPKIKVKTSGAKKGKKVKWLSK